MAAGPSAPLGLLNGFPSPRFPGRWPGLSSGRPFGPALGNRDALPLDLNPDVVSDLRDDGGDFEAADQPAEASADPGTLFRAAAGVVVSALVVVLAAVITRPLVGRRRRRIAPGCTRGGRYGHCRDRRQR
jgi:hypothetical protein